MKTSLKFVENPSKKLAEKSFFSFVKNLSLFSCFYGTYPGELTQIYLLTYCLIYLYISVLIISEKEEFRSLLRIFGLHPIVYWTSRYFFDLIVASIYAFYLFWIFSLNEKEENSQSKFEEILQENNLKMKKEFFLLTFVLSASILPIVYLLTSKGIFSKTECFV